MFTTGGGILWRGPTHPNIYFPQSFWPRNKIFVIFHFSGIGDRRETFPEYSGICHKRFWSPDKTCARITLFRPERNSNNPRQPPRTPRSNKTPAESSYGRGGGAERGGQGGLRAQLHSDRPPHSPELLVANPYKY